MLIATRELATYQPTDLSLSNRAELTSSGSASPFSHTAPSSFEQLLAHQMGNSLSTKSFEVAGSVESHALKANTSGSLPTATSSLANSESFSYLSTHGFLASSNTSAIQTPAISVKGYDTANSGNASNAQAGELQGTTERLMAWQASNEAVMVADLAQAIEIPLETGAMAAGRFELLSSSNAAINAGLMTNDPLNETQTEADAGQEWFLVNEFSVETTTGSVSANATGETPSQAQPVATPATALANDVQHPVTTKDSSAVAGSNLIPTAATVASSHAASAPSLAEEVAKAVTQQLQEEAIGGTTTVRIQLDREDLGSISLFLSINNNKVSVRIVAEDEVSRQLIDSQLDDLRESLAESGVECSEFQVVCDATHDQTSRRRRPSQTPVALGFSPAALRGEPLVEPVVTANQLARFNFVA